METITKEKNEKGKKKSCVVNDPRKMIKCKYAQQLWKCLDTLRHSYCTEE